MWSLVVPLLLPLSVLQACAEFSAEIGLLKNTAIHAPLRLAHIISMAAFFGTILFIDVMVLRRPDGKVDLRSLIETYVPLTYSSFLLAVPTGILCFLYDPISVGNHAWFVPKMICVALALCNAACFGAPFNVGMSRLTSARAMGYTRVATLLSLALWSGAIMFATANHETRPVVRPAVTGEMTGGPTR